MNDAQQLAALVFLGMRVVERIAQLKQESHGDVNGWRTRRQVRLPEDPAQVAAVQVFHRDEVLTSNSSELEDLHDVDVIEQRRELRFLHERANELMVFREMRTQALQRDGSLEPVEPELERAIHGGDRAHT